MSLKKILVIGLAVSLAAVGAGSSNPAHAGSMTYEIAINTTAAGLAPGAGGFVDIQLSPAAPQGPPPSVSTSAFGVITDGTLGSVVMETGTAAGTLPGAVTMNNTKASPPNELLQNFTVHSFFDIFVTLSGPEIGPGSSVFSGTTFSVLVGDSIGAFTGATGYVNPNFPPTIDGTVSFLPGTGVVVIPGDPRAVQRRADGPGTGGNRRGRSMAEQAGRRLSDSHPHPPAGRRRGVPAVRCIQAGCPSRAGPGLFSCADGTVADAGADALSRTTAPHSGSVHTVSRPAMPRFSVPLRRVFPSRPASIEPPPPCFLKATWAGGSHFRRARATLLKKARAG